MAPALRYLHTHHKQDFILAALSNTVPFPADHPFSKPPSNPADDVRRNFDLFIASSDVGLRKPDVQIYQLAVRRLDIFDKGRGGSGVQAEDILFLDDIGENLKSARKLGMRTVRVLLGRTLDAVRELGDNIGVDLVQKVREETERENDKSRAKL
jgi:FMN phosphatase YigB (HAD superfamily)